MCVRDVGCAVRARLPMRVSESKRLYYSHLHYAVLESLTYSRETIQIGFVHYRVVRIEFRQKKHCVVMAISRSLVIKYMA